jgi:hypothetical protein
MSITFSQLGNNGRMGNQLFQMAATISLALNNNDSYLFPTWKYEQHFNLHGCFVNQINLISIYREPHFHYAPIPYKPNLDLNGYFQSYKYMIGHEDFIIDKLTPIYNLDNCNATSIHIRRGDYVNNENNHPVINMDYYNKAIDLCATDKYYIFSDDIAWCKNNFIGNKFEFMEGNHETLDLAIMAKCSNNIIANSSFSLWAAIINKNHDKKIIYPQKWFGPSLQLNTKDLIPQNSNWISI